MIFYIIVTVLLAVVIYNVLIKKKEETSEELFGQFWETKYWALEGSIKEDDKSIREFNIDVPKEDLDQLKQRLLTNRWSLPSLPDTKFKYGIREEMMRKIVKYWANEYNWQNRQNKLNSLPNYKTKIEGLDIHFIHSKANGDVKGTPILMTHGWPGSTVEFGKLIPMLSNPLEHGGTEEDPTFDVICPNIPGYGFSDSPQKKGFNAFECARIFHKLMTRLGYNKYIVQGGDWGSMVMTAVAFLYPENVIAIHTNMFTSQATGIGSMIKQWFASIRPSWFFKPVEAQKLYPLKEYYTRLLVENGYMHLQATKPDTIGFALTDSPVGLAAYLLEKFSSWTNMDARDTDDGMLEKYFTFDELLDNVMVYWLNGNITSSMRFYKENMSKLNTFLEQLQPLPLTIPAGYAWFPEELAMASQAEIKKKFPNLIHFTYMEEGGHFGAFQVPQLMARELRTFTQKLWKVCPEHKPRNKNNKQVVPKHTKL